VALRNKPLAYKGLDTGPSQLVMWTFTLQVNNTTSMVPFVLRLHAYSLKLASAKMSHQLTTLCNAFGARRNALGGFLSFTMLTIPLPG
jgi:hypothetical protein